MAILRRREKRVIDLTGPEGNAYHLLGLANNLCEQLDYNSEQIQKDMTSGDYDNLIKVFDQHFGDIYDLYLGDLEEDEE